MNFESVVTNGQVVVDVGTALPDGTAVQVTVSPAAPPAPIENPHAWMTKYIGQAKGLPPDFAAQHDHYLHGTPKG